MVIFYNMFHLVVKNLFNVAAYVVLCGFDTVDRVEF